jgi:hypothetical protein
MEDSPPDKLDCPCAKARYVIIKLSLESPTENDRIAFQLRPGVNMPKPPPPSTVPQAPFKITIRKASKRNQQICAAGLRKRLARQAEDELDGLDSAPESDPETDEDGQEDSASDGGWGDVSSNEDEQSTDGDVESGTESGTQEEKTQRAIV